MGDGKEGETEVSTMLSGQGHVPGVSDRAELSASADCLIGAVAFLADLRSAPPAAAD